MRVMRVLERAALMLFAVAALSLPVAASSTGPFLGANGIPGGTTCDTAGCHTGAPPADTAQGSVRILGLPNQWTPDATYNLEVIVQRPSAVRFGFQLSAIFLDGRLAGSFSSTDPRISIVMGFSLTTRFVGQYAQHNDAPFGSAQWTFPVRWRAPSNPALGDVTFYVAGNAANGNGANSGDAIYLTSVKVSPASIPVLNSRTYSAANLGAVALNTTGSGTAIDVGYARVLADAASATTAGAAIFGFRTNNVLISETSVPASPLIRSGRVFAEVNASLSVNTGIAIANPNSQSVTIGFFFTNTAGVDSAAGSLVISANGQIAKFLNEPPFNSGSNIQGTFTFISDAPVAVAALRGFTNERGDFLLTTLPVTDLSNASPGGTQVLPLYADGGGWSTQIVLVNTADARITGAIEFYSPGDAATPGALVNRVTYSIAQRSSQKIVTAGTGALTSTGSLRIVPDGGASAPVSFDIFSFKPANFTLASAGVPAISGSAFRMYSEYSGVAGNVGSIQTGIAIANASATPVTVNLELYRLDGTAASTPSIMTLPGSGQVTKFISDLFPGLTQPFQGVLRIAASASVSVVGIRGRYNERSDFLITTTSPSLETTTASVSELFFPHLANGGGYTTQFVLLSSSANQGISGVIRFLKQDGSAFNLTLN